LSEQYPDHQRRTTRSHFGHDRISERKRADKEGQLLLDSGQAAQRQTDPPNTSKAIKAHHSSRPLLESFLAGRNSRTTRAYLQDLTDFTNFLQIETVQDAVSLLVSGTGGEANGIVLA
jgi:hypothetical protein